MKDWVRIPEERMKILRKNKEWIEELESLAECKLRLNEEVCIECEDPLKILRIKEVIKAFGRGFSFEDSFKLLDEDYYLEIINVKDFSGKSKNRMRTLKARVIGSEGKAKKMIERYTNAKIAIYGKTISIIGKYDEVRIAREAIEMLLKGSLHSTVYRFLERSRLG